MAISHLLEDFSAAATTDKPFQVMSDDRLEDLRLAVFEQGYTAGWDDAIRAQADDQSRITGALGSNLEDLSFTYQEALVQMMTAVEPVFHSLIEKVLPEAMMHTMGLHIVEQCCDMAREQVAQPISLVVPTGASDSVRSILQESISMQVEVREDTDMGPGQAYLRVGSQEREIDSERLLSSLRASVDGFVFSEKKATNYG